MPRNLSKSKPTISVPVCAMGLILFFLFLGIMSFSLFVIFFFPFLLIEYNLVFMTIMCVLLGAIFVWGSSSLKEVFSRIFLVESKERNKEYEERRNNECESLPKVSKPFAQPNKALKYFNNNNINNYINNPYCKIINKTKNKDINKVFSILKEN